MPRFERTIGFYAGDFQKTLFPLDTNRILVEKGSHLLGDFIYGKITHKKESSYKFLPQVRAYAAKHGYHLRRTQKLDPVAEFFIYDLVYRNRSAFSKSPGPNRQSFGYRFEAGEPSSAVKSFRAFKAAAHGALKKYKNCARFDVSSYFNSIYHHDLVQWFNDCAEKEEDAQFFDKFLKQTNAGRSIDCLPHGLYPTKMIGSHFLSFVERAGRLSSELLLRFMDDFYLFSDDEGTLLKDFVEIQRLLGEKGLSINPSKTQLGQVNDLDVEKEVDEIKKGLLKRRTFAVMGSGGDIEEFEIEDEALEPEENEYLMSLLKDQHIAEEDAELILTLMREHSDDVLEQLPTFLERFPNLSKNIYYFCESVDDETALAGLVLDYLKSPAQVTEYQLFWLAKLLETYLLKAKTAGDILTKLYEHRNATDISKAKVLEMADPRFGLKDLREEHLRTGASGWLSWASAVGSRVERKQNRNHLLSYFSNGSPMNALIADCIRAI